MVDFGNSDAPLTDVPPHLYHSFNMTPNGASSTDTTLVTPSQPDTLPGHGYIPTSTIAGRKRSRDEAAPNLEMEGEVLFPGATTVPSESGENWQNGEGMTLVKPNGFIIDAANQTGTWVEEKAQPLVPTQMPLPQVRPSLHSNKSQRLDLAATPVILEETTLTHGVVTPTSPPKSVGEPTIDDFTRHLGIGWSRISGEDHIQAAARGWAKFIENHYTLHDVTLRLQSKGLASYLVESREGWFLFREDLKEGRLVASTLERAFENLRSTPPLFDDCEILQPVSDSQKTTDEMEVSKSLDIDPGVEMSSSSNNSRNSAGQSGGTEMDES